MLARQQGLETHVVDPVADGPKPALVADLGAHHHYGPVAEVPVEPDLVIECTGLGQAALDAARRTAPGAVMALTGIAHGAQAIEARPDEMNKALVLGNKAVFGSVNAARRHYDQAANALARADPAWLARDGCVPSNGRRRSPRVPTTSRSSST
jgi:glucose 1-dehydrogenase